MTQVELNERILAFENGTLDENETIELFQELIDNGRAWTLQGSYGQTANDLIEAGLCTPPSQALTP
jgi:hypothetical protein